MPSLAAMLHGVCPRCRRGRIYRRPFLRAWLDMNPLCPECGLHFDREQGYFIGAMYVSYLLSVPPVGFLVAAIWMLTRWRIDYVLLAAFFGYLPAVPLVVRISRVIWIHVDQWFDPERVPHG
jgi:uncharacterized protein (DUF983 family)